jgi:hypothetical protein
MDEPRTDAERMREERDKQKAEQAFWTYYHMGPERTLGKLFNKFVEMAHNGEAVPTRHKPKITEWRAKYNWEARILELDSKVVESELRDYEKMKRLALDGLVDLSQDALTTLGKLIRNEGGQVPERIQLQAVQAVLDRIGISAKTAPTTDNTKSQTLPPPPPVDSPEDVLESYYARIKSQQQ